jgi:hypothetical protein
MRRTETAAISKEAVIFHLVGHSICTDMILFRSQAYKIWRPNIIMEIENLFYKGKRIGCIQDGSWSFEKTDGMLAAYNGSETIEARGAKGTRYIDPSDFRTVINEKLGFTPLALRKIERYL